MRTTDNNKGSFKINRNNREHSDLFEIANRKLIDLKDNNPNLLVFPHSFEQYRDDFSGSDIFSLDEEKLTTYNIMGFIGRNETTLTINSRFEENGHDYFLHYMLQKVFAINILDFHQTPDKENIWDFLLYLFPYFLKKAYSQGLYKAYKRENYNDANVKGTIDVKRYLRINVPFAGKIAYTTREHSHDNPVTQLIRHTIEHIRVHPWGSGVLGSDSDTRDIVSKICFVTQNSYNKNARQKIISQNLKPVNHPYFTEYKPLQNICLRILRHDKLTFGKEKDKIYGLLFDGAWLWEAYLNTFLKKDFEYLDNKKKTDRTKYKLFLDLYDKKEFQPICPDFISKQREKTIVADAKYIPLDKQMAYTEDSEKATSIYYKTITYMYRFNSKNGFLLYPTKESSVNVEEYKIIDTDGKLTKLGLSIPQNIDNFRSFIDIINTNEQKFISVLKSSSSQSVVTTE